MKFPLWERGRATEVSLLLRSAYGCVHVGVSGEGAEENRRLCSSIWSKDAQYPLVLPFNLTITLFEIFMTSKHIDLCYRSVHSCMFMASLTSLLLSFRSGKVWSPTGIEENKSPCTGTLESESQV